jgi:hypothetical protein
VFHSVSPPSYGICSLIDKQALNSIANPHLNDDHPGAIIAFPDETFGLLNEIFGLAPSSRVHKKFL